MITASAYIGFNGRAEEALTFYESVFVGELRLMHFSDMHIEDHGDWVMHGQLTTPEGWTLMCSDNPQATVPESDPRIGLCLWGDDEDRARALFDALAEGGEVTTPLAQQMWGDLYGDLTDRFGVSWSVDVSPAQP